MIATSSGELPTSPVSLGPREWLKDQHNEGNTVSGNAGTLELFAVKCEDVQACKNDLHALPKSSMRYFLALGKVLTVFAQGHA